MPLDEMLEQRLAVIDSVFADPPSVHPGAVSPLGDVWSTDRDCYAFLAAHCRGGARTLETGLGVSTVLFAAWGTEHVCVVPDEEQVRRCLEHCRSRGIRTEQLRFETGFSEYMLPRLELPLLDVVLVDGGHAFPVSIIDWFYAGSRLRRGGVMVLDDVQLPHLSLGLLPFLEKDPRWTCLEATEKWIAYRKDRDDGSLSEPWTAQDFIYRGRVHRGARSFARRVRQRLRERSEIRPDDPEFLQLRPRPSREGAPRPRGR